MGDKIPVRVFDSVTAAVANAEGPPPPPYAPAPEEPVKAAKNPRKAAAKKTAPPAKAPAKKAAPEPIKEEPVTGVTVHAGTAGLKTKAHDTK